MEKTDPVIEFGQKLKELRKQKFEPAGCCFCLDILLRMDKNF